MALAPVLNALTMGAWALFLGMLAGSYRSDKPPRRRWVLAVVAGLWLVVAGVQLWREPAIEPHWLQYLLLLPLPTAVGLGFAVIAQHFGGPRDTQPPRGPSDEEAER